MVSTPTVIVTLSPVEKHRRSLSVTSAGPPHLSADSNNSTLSSSSSLSIPNWRDRLDTIAPRGGRSPTSPSGRFRLPLVLAACATIIFCVSRTNPNSPYTYPTTQNDLLAFRPIPVTTDPDLALAAWRANNASEVERQLNNDAPPPPPPAPVGLARHKGVAGHAGKQRQKYERDLDDSPAAAHQKRSKCSKTAKKVVKSKKTASKKHQKHLNSFYAKTYSGVATHFPGSAAALACGDVYDSPSTTKFAALCHTTFDASPGSTTTTRTNPNKSPTCGSYVAGRKSLTGSWMSKVKSLTAYVTVGGDGEYSCVGTADVKCHIPRTIAITRGGKTVTGVKVVDRNQGLAPSPCAAGDVDVSDLVYLTLGDTTVLSSALSDVTWKWE
ncbi:hypothetical protein RQP46_008719 [Phenoliferia psychrophenolica]